MNCVTSWLFIDVGEKLYNCAYKFGDIYVYNFILCSAVCFLLFTRYTASVSGAASKSCLNLSHSRPVISVFGDACVSFPCVVYNVKVHCRLLISHMGVQGSLDLLKPSREP
jgi:hypothetical protein